LHLFHDLAAQQGVFFQLVERLVHLLSHRVDFLQHLLILLRYPFEFLLLLPVGGLGRVVARLRLHFAGGILQALDQVFAGFDNVFGV